MQKVKDDLVIDELKKVNNLFHRIGIPESIRTGMFGIFMFYIKKKCNVCRIKSDKIEKHAEKLYKSSGKISEDISDIFMPFLGEEDDAKKILSRYILLIQNLDFDSWNKIFGCSINILSYVSEDKNIDLWTYARNIFGKYDDKNHNQVYTPLHIAELMGNIAGADSKKIIMDGACGNGALLRGVLSRKAKQYKGQNLYGIETDETAYFEARVIMLFEGALLPRLIHGNCFLAEETICQISPDIILLNPPFNSNPKDIPEQYKKCWKSDAVIDPTKGLCFVEYFSDVAESVNHIRMENGKRCKEIKLAVLLPIQAAMSTTNYIKEAKKNILAGNTLEAVFSLPKDIFYPNGISEICCMLFTLGKPHFDAKGQARPTFFGYYKDDMFETRKNVGRVAVYDDEARKWDKISREWMTLYKNKEVIAGKTAVKCVSAEDEWLSEAYVATDYSKLTENDFLKTINDYFVFKVQNGLAGSDMEEGDDI